MTFGPTTFPHPNLKKFLLGPRRFPWPGRIGLGGHVPPVATPLYFDKVGVVNTNTESQRSDANCTTYLRWTFVDLWLLCTALFMITRNSSGDEIANVNFLYDEIVHALENAIDLCINSATGRFLQRRFTKFSEITQCNGHYAVQGSSRSPILVPIESSYTTSY